ncbi:hypothetical protein BOV88_00115 [Solemya velum gill symbiont]|uniref:Uncharacterized protein n=1 Tax=Solemya velum gill symbiont TaxID=2340 RepID=A0A1T2CPF6_SOVGS|nr:hypothetical protein BOV88_00115 [Solemya velum gill symbiont]OOY36739.1 hypothetical protein BOV89_11130 [Solemya velum gill symbiont]OOY66251.1 hypothetical protein BOW05_02755 [Solemya velum gill symbiont]OOZ02192.1 hypothetical protein BOW20_02740 [Solemya velum gill symbiont]
MLVEIASVAAIKLRSVILAALIVNFVVWPALAMTQTTTPSSIPDWTRFAPVEGQVAEAYTTSSVDESVQQALQVEMGSAFADNEWQVVELEQTFVNPVVILGVPGDNSIEPGVARMRHLEPGSFELKFQEWMYLDQAHPPESIDWMVFESGSYELDDGTMFEVGTFP